MSIKVCGVGAEVNEGKMVDTIDMTTSQKVTTFGITDVRVGRTYFGRYVFGMSLARGRSASQNIVTYTRQDPEEDDGTCRCTTKSFAAWVRKQIKKEQA